MPVHGLTENHERGLLASVQYSGKLIRDCEEALAASDRPSPLNRYTGGLTPPQRKIAKDYLQRLSGVAVPVRPVSVMPSHEDLLRVWAADDVMPLGLEAVGRRREALGRKVAVLRAQAAAMLEHRTTGGRPLDARDTAVLVSRFRDVSAALDRTIREFSSFSERRDAIVEATLAAASARLAEILGSQQGSVESVRDESTRPAQQEAERVAEVLQRLANDVTAVLSDAAVAAGMAYGSPKALGGQREMPLITLPPVSLPAKAPAWTRISAALVREWAAARLQEHWAPALDRAVAAYLDVLKRWAADGVSHLRDEFESHSRPLLAQLSPESPRQPSMADAALVESDLQWLRRAADPHETPHGSASLSILHQE
jgi:hypothetical protein